MIWIVLGFAALGGFIGGGLAAFLIWLAKHLKDGV